MFKLPYQFEICTQQFLQLYQNIVGDTQFGHFFPQILKLFIGDTSVWSKVLQFKFFIYHIKLAFQMSTNKPSISTVVFEIAQTCSTFLH